MTEMTVSPSPVPAVSDPDIPSSFRTMMAGFPTGVAVVTAFGAEGVRRGMTCSSVCSVALTPPTLLVCLRRGSPTLDAALHGGGFAVNLLHGRAQAAAELFASGASNRFDLITLSEGPDHAGPHLTHDAHTVADCHVVGTHPVGDHVVVLGEVYRIGAHGDGEPLLYGKRRYRTWPED